MRDSIYFLWIENRILVVIITMVMMIVSCRCVLGLENINPIFFDEGLSHLFGEGNLIRSPDDRSVRLLLDKYTGSGFISSSMYQHGFFSSLIKLPGAYTAGIVVAFYTSNGDVFVKNHDELDIEFLGNLEGKPWRFQTNMYGNGSTNRGREERYRLWFDPSKEFHRYSILWTPTKIIFWVDDVPIREIFRKEEMEGDYPQKPMSLYATIWDASSWATSGGKFGVDYTFAPFVSEFKDIALDGCNVSDSLPTVTGENNNIGYDHINCSVSDQFLMTNDYSTISPKQAASMRRFRERYMYYSYCYDTIRYSVPPPECVIVTAEKNRFRDTGRLKFGGSHPKVHKARKKRRRNRSTPVSVVSADL
ncbi:PREDICTED: probable xyloglucan endotransglucosylase/hydrolase protein 29 [Camelina sativa]|uniref:Xyloglucan endotransglucosylase/hydrolase n=1 Tax=Camelina sativa TaxID=90675 RepID=A0ABM0V1I9_CAMSA|nr:PREDICTED: probable xyloglucan endotransglucosylase/hydrolase protein 29 [Camelina sativa]